MKKYYFRVSCVYEAELVTIEAWDSKGNFLGVAAEPTIEEALSEIKQVVSDILEELAYEGKNPIQNLLTEKGPDTVELLLPYS